MRKEIRLRALALCSLVTLFASSCEKQQALTEGRTETNSIPQVPAEDRKEAHEIIRVKLASTSTEDPAELVVTDVSVRTYKPKKREVTHYFADIRKIEWVPVNRGEEAGKPFRLITETNTLDWIIADFPSFESASNVLATLRVGIAQWQKRFPAKAKQVQFTEWTEKNNYGFNEEEVKAAFDRAQQHRLIGR